MPSKQKLEKEKNKRAIISIDMKHKIIEKHKRDLCVTDLGRAFNLSKSTISTILKNKDKLEVVNASKGVSRVSAQRSPILDDVERSLLIWINEKQMRGDTLSPTIICEKAKRIFTNLIEKSPGTSTANGHDFKASKEWFEKFKKRTGIHIALRHGEAASSDTKAGYLPQQIFNCDETDLTRKTMPKRTYITSVGKNTLSDNRVIEEQQPSSAIKEMLKAWESVASYVKRHHPNQTEAARATKIFNDIAVSHFQQVLKRRQILYKF